MVWVRQVDGVARLEASQHQARARWGLPARLSRPGHHAYEPAVLVAVEGLTTVTWSDSPGVGSRIVAHRVVDGVADRTTLSHGEDDFGSVLVDSGPGNTFAAWTRDAGGTLRAQMRGGGLL